MTDDGQGQQEETPKEDFNFHMRVTTEWAEHLRMVADYAAKRGIISDDQRGNMAAWVNYCLNYMEKLLTQDYKQAGV